MVYDLAKIKIKSNVAYLKSIVFIMSAWKVGNF